MKALERLEEKDPEKVRRDQERLRGRQELSVAAGTACPGVEAFGVHFGTTDAVPDDRARSACASAVYLDRREFAAGREGEAHGVDSDRRRNHGGVFIGWYGDGAGTSGSPG